MKKVFKTTNVCRNLTNLIRTLLVICVAIVIVATARIYYINNQEATNPQFTDGNLEIVMIDVGNADCFLLLQKDKAMLVDTGYFTTYFDVKKVLEEKNVQKIDYAIITHSHRDHAGGIFGLLLDYQVSKLYLTEKMEDLDMSFTERLFYIPEISMIKYTNLFAENVVDVRLTEDNYDFQFSDSQIQFLGPISSNYCRLNNYSLVFKMIYKEKSILFTGDMEIPNEEELLNANVDLSADILKIAHHGSKTSTSEAFLEAVNPRYAILSSHNGKHNEYGHPVKRIVESLEKRGIILYRTDELGTVELELDGNSVNFVQNPGDYKSGTQFLKEERGVNRM